MLNSSWRNRTMIAKPSCSKQMLWPKQPSTLPLAISTLQNRLSQRPKPRRNARGSPTHQTFGGVNTSVAKLRAELADAEFDLDQTTVRAAGPGFATQVSLRPGMYVIPTQLRTAMLFVNTGRGDQQLVGAFQQNSLQRVDAGDEAEVAFDAVPGRVFKAKVRTVIGAIATGQLATTPTL